MLFQSMDVLILQGRGGGARRRSPSPRSLTLGVYEFIVSRNFNLWLQVESLLNISIFLSIFNSHFFGWVDKLRTILCFHKRRVPLVVCFSDWLVG